jgi:hypothetical protein
MCWDARKLSLTCSAYPCKTKGRCNHHQSFSSLLQPWWNYEGFKDGSEFRSLIIMTVWFYLNFELVAHGIKRCAVRSVAYIQYSHGDDGDLCYLQGCDIMYLGSSIPAFQRIQLPVFMVDLHTSEDNILKKYYFIIFVLHHTWIGW